MIPTLMTFQGAEAEVVLRKVLLLMKMRTVLVLLMAKAKVKVLQPWEPEETAFLVVVQTMILLLLILVLEAVVVVNLKVQVWMIPMLTDLEKEVLPMVQVWKILGMISHKMSLITIFGHKHFTQKFHQKVDIFHEKNSTVSDFGSYLE